jgi:hypothetical protein
MKRRPGQIFSDDYYQPPKEMTVKKFRKLLNELIEQGYGDELIQAFDVDSNAYENVTGVTFAGSDKVVKIYTDI